MPPLLLEIILRYKFILINCERPKIMLHHFYTESFVKYVQSVILYKGTIFQERINIINYSV